MFSPLTKTAFVLLIVVLAWRFWPSSGMPKVTHAVKVHCETTKGPLEIVVQPEWSPNAAQRFLQMVDEGFYTDLPLFRCIAGFVCQFGSAVPKPNAKTYAAFQDDPQLPGLREFKPGYISFAGFAPNTRAVHVFIALSGAESLGSQVWETPFGFVTSPTMQSTVTQFNTEYGDMPPAGTGPDPRKIEARDGAEYLHREFPKLDYIQSCQRMNSY